jgi:hypothetical protein
MKKIPTLLNAMLFALPVLIITTGCDNAGNAAKTGTTDSVAAREANGHEHHSNIDEQQALIYSIDVNSNDGKAILQATLLAPNMCIVSGLDAMLPCFLLVNATVDNSVATACKITIVPGSRVIEEDRTGNCPDNCDIHKPDDFEASQRKVLDCNSPFRPILYVNENGIDNITPINSKINDFAKGHQNDYNVLKLNTVTLTQLFADNPDVSDILVRVSVTDAARTVTYQAWHKPLASWEKMHDDYVDPNPVLYMNTTTVNNMGKGKQ